MSVAFKELGGSPVEEYTLEGFSALREFLIAWEDRDQFAAEVLGTTSQLAGTPPVHYPGRESVVAVKLRYEPFNPDSPDAKTIPGLTDGLNGYSGSFAKAAVRYKTITERDRMDGPINEIGTHLTYRMLFAVESQPIVPRGWNWEDDASIPTPDDLNLTKRIPITEHHLTWHQVINPPWTTIHDLQGTVNSSEFLGCPAQTLLFEGADANKLFRAGFEAGASEFVWQIHYLFRERSIKYAGEVFGWNHHYREKPAGWEELTNGSARLYDAADFLPLFQSAEGV
jgi:hypothetical protein